MQSSLDLTSQEVPTLTYPSLPINPNRTEVPRYRVGLGLGRRGEIDREDPYPPMLRGSTLIVKRDGPLTK